MPILEFDCFNIGPLKIYGRQLNNRPDFIVESNSGIKEIDYLLFFDSRGVSSSYKSSLAKMMVDRVSGIKKTYLLVCRPLELTIWATLVGFLQLNELAPERIVTNMRFVDFTPKKSTTLLEAIHQTEEIIGKDVAESYFVENYHQPNEISKPLYSMRFNERYLRAIENIARKSDLVVLNTPLTDRFCSWARPRPRCFFDAQLATNNFNRLITKAKVVDFPTLTPLYTYDGVHFTPKGNRLIFDKIKDLL